MKFSKADLARIHELSVTAKQGKLAPEERTELEYYLHVGNLLGLLHSRARMALKPRAEKKRRKSA